MDDLTLIARSKRRPIDDDTRSESGALEAADDDAYTRKCKLSYILIFPYPCNTYFNRPLILKKNTRVPSVPYHIAIVLSTERVNDRVMFNQIDWH